MQAPSRQLLRALRAAVRTSLTSTSPSTSTTAARQTCLRHIPLSSRTLSTTTPSHDQLHSRTRNRYAPKHAERGPKSTEDTQTDFGVMDVLGHVPTPATSVDACTSDGFHLDNGVKTEGGAGVLLVGGEAFKWEPWRCMDSNPNNGTPTATLGTMLDARRGVLSIPSQSLGLLELVHPKPDLLIVGTGGRLWMLSKEVRAYIGEVLGCRLDVMDTANAAAAYNLLAKERGVEGGAGVGALLLPVGWVGVKAPVRR
ncbi:hypothetical protein LTR70_002664 [Exophiala xenobiotica]|uniref:NADH dehydrogenase [ubiquinone] 1 alpha subcomplex assembly factor 3 n=1 Tax=Lithohypha guttulata TaxID=1690604 RepID=A0ABR0JW06_9EURO|nr:hypothetical protein LTR24_009791 [Lithohypha guttulata]KAK5325282.1 hypothetical protein LTR70_002664 [Exophiala xenobiotica]